MDEKTLNVMDRLGFKLLLPTQLFYSLYRAEWDVSVYGKPLLASIVIILIILVLALLIFGRLEPDPKRRGPVIQCEIRVNFVIFGMAIIASLYGSENIFKELGRVFTYPGSGNSITDIQHGTNQAISTGALNGAGTYVAWQIHVNYEGSLSGRYRVVEQIPDGMEVTYVRGWDLKQFGRVPNPPLRGSQLRKSPP